MNARDTQFAGFAREVTRELLGLRYQTVYYNDPQMLDHFEQVIARRAYDLACHIATETLTAAHGDMSKISDLAELPKE